MKLLPILKIFIPVLIITIFIEGAFIVKTNFKKENNQVLSEVVLPTIKPSATPTSTPSATPILLKKSQYSIAIFGDSMVDTMGENLEYLQKALANKYPQTKFTLYNYGIGGQNIEQGLARFESTFTNRERNFPPIPALQPDILILGSFAYNPFSTHDRNKHYLLLKELVTKAKQLSSRLYLFAEIAPLKLGFGEGKNGVNMPTDVAYKHALNIIEQLDNVINLSSSENIPLINAYYASKIDMSFGNPYYVNPDDGIHPSFAGHVFTAGLIANIIKLN